MKAAVAQSFSDDDPLSGLAVVDDHPEPELHGDDWEVVEVRAAAVNHHDVWSLRGVGLAEDELPRVLGSDAAGVTGDGRRVVLYPVVGIGKGPGILSERVDGTHAERVAIPSGNVIELPDDMTFETAACLPTAWLTAWSMLNRTGATSGDRVLVQGATGGVASAAVLLGVREGYEMVVTSRHEDKRAQALEWGAAEAVEPGARLGGGRVTGVIETVGDATFEHSQKSLAPGGTIVVAGATTGHLTTIDLRRLFALGQQVVGHSMGSKDELQELVDACARHDLVPEIDSTWGLDRAEDAYARLVDGEVVGKVVLRIGD